MVSKNCNTIYNVTYVNKEHQATTEMTKGFYGAIQGICGGGITHQITPQDFLRLLEYKINLLLQIEKFFWREKTDLDHPNLRNQFSTSIVYFYRDDVKLLFWEISTRVEFSFAVGDICTLFWNPKLCPKITFIFRDQLTHPT